MPLSRVRCCIPCGRIRYAPCSTGCRVDPENDPTSWTEQVPPAAGTELHVDQAKVVPGTRD